MQHLQHRQASHPLGQCGLLGGAAGGLAQAARHAPPTAQPPRRALRQRAGPITPWPLLLGPSIPGRRSAVRALPASLGQPDDASQPFRRVVLPTALALLLCNMDRICLSVAIIPMAAEFGWSGSLQGVIQSAFLWGYMATQLLGGSLADAHGGKRVLAAGIAWFSCASMLLPAALSGPVAASGLAVPALLGARCLVGLGEGVALPSMSNLVATFVPKEAKARALGGCFTGFHSGNLVGLLLSPLILMAFGWRALFYSFGLFGLPLLAVWLAVVPDAPTTPQPPSQPASPASTTSTSSTSTSSTSTTTTTSTTSSSSSSGDDALASTSGAGAVTVWQLMSRSATWAIIAVNIVNHWGYFIYLNWMPTYFVKVMGFDLRGSSFMAFLPWLVMAVGSSLAGVLADALVARGVAVLTVRKAVQAVAFLVPAAALMALAQPGLSPQAAVLLMTVALGTTSLGQAGFVANMSDIAPRHAGKMFGLCNTFGCLSGIVGVTAVGCIMDATNSFSTVFQLTAGLYVLGTAVWLALARGERVF